MGRPTLDVAVVVEAVWKGALRRRRPMLVFTLAGFAALALLVAAVVRLRQVAQSERKNRPALRSQDLSFPEKRVFLSEKSDVGGFAQPCSTGAEFALSSIQDYDGPDMLLVDPEQQLRGAMGTAPYSVPQDQYATPFAQQVHGHPIPAQQHQQLSAAHSNQQHRHQQQHPAAQLQRQAMQSVVSRAAVVPPLDSWQDQFMLGPQYQDAAAPAECGLVPPEGLFDMDALSAPDANPSPLHAAAQLASQPQQTHQSNVLSGQRVPPQMAQAQAQPRNLASHQWNPRQQYMGELNPLMGRRANSGQSEMARTLSASDPSAIVSQEQIVDPLVEQHQLARSTPLSAPMGVPTPWGAQQAQFAPTEPQYTPVSGPGEAIEGWRSGLAQVQQLTGSRTLRTASIAEGDEYNLSRTGRASASGGDHQEWRQEFGYASGSGGYRMSSAPFVPPAASAPVPVGVPDSSTQVLRKYSGRPMYGNGQAAVAHTATGSDSTMRADSPPSPTSLSPVPYAPSASSSASSSVSDQLPHELSFLSPTTKVEPPLAAGISKPRQGSKVSSSSAMRRSKISTGVAAQLMWQKHGRLPDSSDVLPFIANGDSLDFTLGSAPSADHHMQLHHQQQHQAAHRHSKESVNLSDGGDSAFKCPHCPASFRMRGYLTRHLKKHAEVMMFTCPFFDGSNPHRCHPTGGFSRRDTYKMHLKSRHFIYPAGTTRKLRSHVPGQCIGCRKEFPDNEVWIERHLLKNECPAVINAQALREISDSRSHSHLPHSHSQPDTLSQQPHSSVKNYVSSGASENPDGHSSSDIGSHDSSHDEENSDEEHRRHSSNSQLDLSNEDLRIRTPDHILRAAAELDRALAAS